MGKPVSATSSVKQRQYSTKKFSSSSEANQPMLLPLLPVPCLPRHIKASMDCERATAVVTWDFSPGAMSYVATATTTSGHVATCDTTHTNCEMSSLACGERYFVSVLARGETCNSTSKMPRQLMTGKPALTKHAILQRPLLSKDTGRMQFTRH